MPSDWPLESITNRTLVYSPAVELAMQFETGTKTWFGGVNSAFRNMVDHIVQQLPVEQP